jgi:dUTP pyrophosphatase
MGAKSVTVRIKRLRDVPLPSRQTEGAAGFDLCSAEPATVKAHGFASVGTGLAFEMPAGFEAQVRPRSGLAARHGVGLLNGPGTIDSDYRGEVRVVLFNASGEDYEVRPGDRIAQLVFSSLCDVEMVESGVLTETARGPAGFGHTG